MHVLLIGGSGGFGRYHLHAWRKHPAVDRITVAGRDAERLAGLRDEFGVETATEWDAALEAADLVDLCTPTDTHRELAERSILAGRPTIVEKPPCRTAAEAAALGALAGAQGVPLFCVQNQRFAPLWRRVREVLADGLLGPVRLSLWPVLTDQTTLMQGSDFRADAARGGGALLDGAIHLAYLIPFVLGAPVRTVTAWAGRLAVEPPAGEDSGLLALEVGSGVAQLTYSWAVPHAPRTPAATILGELGTLLVPRSARQPLELVRSGEASDIGLGVHQTAPRNDLAACLGHYLACSRTHTEAEASWEDAVAAQRVVEAAEESARAGRRIELP